MSLGQRLLELRKKTNLSQEEVAEKLNVTRQTISKWETDASTPDFDKIIPICTLYQISSEELLTGKKRTYEKSNLKDRPLLLYLSIFMYFISIIWIIISEETLNLNEGIIVSVFLCIIALATVILIYYIQTRPNKSSDTEEKIIIQNKSHNKVIFITRRITLIIYLVISFITMAWHITWLIWIIYSLIIEIIKLIYSLRGEKNEK